MLHGLEKELDRVQGLPLTDATQECKLRLQTDLQELRRRKEILSKYKSVAKWLMTPNLNTHYFHLSTLIRRRKNSIEALKNERGHWLQGREVIGSHIVDYFSNLFSSCNLYAPPDLPIAISKLITDEDDL